MRCCRAELEKCYNFTELAVQLNELEAGVAPTDSRLRPDQRLMELGDWDDANTCKVLLEEKQRAARRQRERLMEDAAALGLTLHTATLTLLTLTVLTLSILIPRGLTLTLSCSQTRSDVMSGVQTTLQTAGRLHL